MELEDDLRDHAETKRRDDRIEHLEILHRFKQESLNKGDWIAVRCRETEKLLACAATQIDAIIWLSVACEMSFCNGRLGMCSRSEYAQSLTRLHTSQHVDLIRATTSYDILGTYGVDGR